jgi:hypothetical protein
VNPLRTLFGGEPQELVDRFSELLLVWTPDHHPAKGGPTLGAFEHGDDRDLAERRADRLLQPRGTSQAPFFQAPLGLSAAGALQSPRPKEPEWTRQREQRRGSRSAMTLPDLPSAFDPAFLADLPYDPSVLMFDQILALDAEQSRVICRMPTDQPIPFTLQQRAHPERHPRHVAGAALVHATGMLGFVHAYYLLDVRHAQGWIGYGTHIHKGVFRKLVPPGSPIEAVCTATRLRLGKERHVIRYAFEFRHEGAVCYEGDQSAIWMRT